LGVLKMTVFHFEPPSLNVQSMPSAAERSKPINVQIYHPIHGDFK